MENFIEKIETFFYDGVTISFILRLDRCRAPTKKQQEVLILEDNQIIALYFGRSEQAIVETDRKYGPYCFQIASHILSSPEDGEECVSDTYLTAWKSIPPNRPDRLAPFLGKITRHIALDRWRRRLAQKRGGGEVQLALEELEDCIPGKDSPEEALHRKQFRDGMNRFLGSLPEQERMIFVSRYWYLRSIREISQGTGLSEGSIKTRLFRTRSKLRTFLAEEELL